MKLKLAILALIGLSFSGCTSSLTSTAPSVERTKQTYQQPTPEKQAGYSSTMKMVASGIKDDPKYNKIAFDTPEKKAWFRDLTYRLWDRQITNSQFISEGLAKYPTHRYEFQFIVNGFQKHS